VAAIFSLALLYASMCSATCAICFGAGAAAENQSHACEHAASDAAGGAEPRSPAKPDCLGHHHSGFEVIQSDGLRQFPLSAMGGASQLSVAVVRREGVGVSAPFLSDLAPPGHVTISPQQKISILRIWIPRFWTFALDPS
jgi:hypothetical protein